MKNTFFKKTLVLSLLSHITLFSIFSFSFGNKVYKPDYAPVNFWGQVGSVELSNSSNAIIRGIKELFIDMPDTPKPKIITENPVLSGNYYLKPVSMLSFSQDKVSFAKKSQPFPYLAKRKEAVIIFHPLLPYDFSLYFKDRQLAHVELAFNIISDGRRISPIVKRRISSGNLEVDLLSVRYISRYLFMQQASFTPNNWRTVKIDLSANKND